MMIQERLPYEILLNDFIKIIHDEKKKVSIIDTLNKGDVSALNRLLKNQ